MAGGAEISNLGGGFSKLLAAGVVVENQLRPSFCEFDCAAFPNATSGPGYEGAFPIEPEIIR
jgi:hypothetical protein